jgi:hypothetical protein
MEVGCSREHVEEPQVLEAQPNKETNGREVAHNDNQMELAKPKFSLPFYHSLG